ncbi:MAG: hypothetical protein AAFO08_06075 [Pseudomonadota bacterium]
MSAASAFYQAKMVWLWAQVPAEFYGVLMQLPAPHAARALVAGIGI